MKTTRTLLSTIIAVLAFVAATQTSYAQVVPYKASGTDAQFDSVNETYSGTGMGTHLGKHQIDGTIVYGGDLTFFPAPGIFVTSSFTGTQVATAANGDKLASDLSGNVTLVFEPDGSVSGIWFPTFEIDQTKCTGRFKNASGTLEGVAINPPFNPIDQFWAFDWFIDGEFDMGK